MKTIFLSAVLFTAAAPCGAEQPAPEQEGYAMSAQQAELELTKTLAGKTPAEKYAAIEAYIRQTDKEKEARQEQLHQTQLAQLKYNLAQDSKLSAAEQTKTLQEFEKDYHMLNELTKTLGINLFNLPPYERLYFNKTNEKAHQELTKKIASLDHKAKLNALLVYNQQLLRKLSDTTAQHQAAMAARVKALDEAEESFLISIATFPPAVRAAAWNLHQDKLEEEYTSYGQQQQQRQLALSMKLIMEDTELGDINKANMARGMEQRLEDTQAFTKLLGLISSLPTVQWPDAISSWKKRKLSEAAENNGNAQIYLHNYSKFLNQIAARALNAAQRTQDIRAFMATIKELPAQQWQGAALLTIKDKQFIVSLKDMPAQELLTAVAKKLQQK